MRHVRTIVGSCCRAINTRYPYIYVCSISFPRSFMIEISISRSCRTNILMPISTESDESSKASLRPCLSRPSAALCQHELASTRMPPPFDRLRDHHHAWRYGRSTCVRTSHLRPIRESVCVDIYCVQVGRAQRIDHLVLVSDTYRRPPS